MLPIALGADIYPSRSPLMRELYEAIRGISGTDHPILLIGEQGTGKSVIARFIHAQQGLQGNTYHTLVCATATPASIQQAFLDTRPVHSDNSQTIHTVFLNNLLDLTAHSQQALTEALNDKQQTCQNSPPTVRFISAARRSLEEDVRAKRFREDLFYRLNGISLCVPPLRQRKEDIPYLASFFLSGHHNTSDSLPARLQDTTLRALLQYTWPGNIEELEDFAKTVLLSGEIGALAEFHMHFSGTSNDDGLSPSLPLKEATKQASRQVERELILNTLARTRWNRKQAARVLGISYKALLYKLKHIALEDPLWIATRRLT